MATKILTDSGLSKYHEDITDYIDDKTIVLTQSEYDALPSEVQNDGTIYFIPDGAGSGGTASDISYDNSDSGLSAISVQGAIDELAEGGGGSANTDLIAADYDSTSTYAVGDYCIHENGLYKCSTAITTAEVWTAAHWTATNVDTELDSKMNTTNPTGTGSFSLNRKANTTVGSYSTAEGFDGTASGYCSHSEGWGTEASGSFSHAEGTYTKALGSFSHAEGYGSTTNGSYSHAEGQSTIANHKSQHVFGEYNIPDSSTALASERGNYVEIVGNGDTSTTSNARTLDWSGNEVLSGTLTTTDVVKSGTGTGATWDGTNTSLATALTNKLAKSFYSPIYATSGTYGRHITNALLVDTSTSAGDENKSGYSIYSDTYAPSNMAFGIREVYWYNSTEIWVKYTGLANNTSTPRIWFNRYNGSDWSGWEEIVTRPNLSSENLTSCLNSTYFTTDAYTDYQNRIWIDEQAVHITCWCRATQNVPANTQVFRIPSAFQPYIGSSVRAVYLDVNSSMFEGGISGNGGLYLDGQIGAGANVRCNLSLCYV